MGETGLHPFDIKKPGKKTGVGTLLIAFILLPVLIYSQTCVIAKKTKRAIYVGADSRVSRYSQNAITKKVYFDTFSVCKIYHVGNNNFALIGAYIQEARELALEKCAAMLPSIH